jgi:hypothetical protein
LGSSFAAGTTDGPSGINEFAQCRGTAGHWKKWGSTHSPRITLKINNGATFLLKWIEASNFQFLILDAVGIYSQRCPSRALENVGLPTGRSWFHHRWSLGVFPTNFRWGARGWYERAMRNMTPSNSFFQLLGEIRGGSVDMVALDGENV